MAFVGYERLIERLHTIAVKQQVSRSCDCFWEAPEGTALGMKEQSPDGKSALGGNDFESLFKPVDEVRLGIGFKRYGCKCPCALGVDVTQTGQPVVLPLQQGGGGHGASSVFER